jgi:flagellar biosynthesis GTPase FlhF
VRRRLELLILTLCAGLCAAWNPFWRTQPDIDDGIRAYQEKKWSEALEAFDRAAKEIPDTPEIHLGRGDVYYQQALSQDAAQRFQGLTLARDEFQRSLTFDPAPKKAAAYHNLATTVTQLAMLEKKEVKGQVQPVGREERIGLLRTAIDAFKKALDLASEDLDTKYNLEVAQRLLEQLEDEKKKEQQKQDQQKQDQQKQDQQKQDQQKQDQQKQDQQKQDQQKQDQQKQDQQKQDQQKQDQQKQDQQKQDQKSEKPKEVPLDLAPLEALKNSEKPLQLYRIMLDPSRSRIRVKKDW